MSSRDPRLRLETARQVFAYVCDRTLRKVRTAIPGTIVAYDAETRRARVEPAVEMLLTDNRSMPRAVILDVPVLWPSVGDWLIHFPLAAGDHVLLVFCQRDISGFKALRRRGRLPTDRILDEQDAVALPGFGPTGRTTPASATGISIQSADGETAITVEDGHVTIKASRITLDYPGGPIDYT